MIHKNMSDETIVLNDKYDNLPILNILMRNLENMMVIQYSRFAKVDGQLGVIPKILQALLGERKR